MKISIYKLTGQSQENYTYIAESILYIQQEETNNEFVELKWVNHARYLFKTCRKENKRTA